MIVRMAMAVLAMWFASADGLAQRDRPTRFPAEKFTDRPVQPQMNEMPTLLSLGANPQRSRLVETPWTKFCGNGKSDPGAGEFCFIIKYINLRLPTGPFVASVAVIETASDGKRILRAILPSDLKRSSAVHMRVDTDPARDGELGQCGVNGCMWDFAADAALVGRLKAGDRLHIEGVAESGAIASYDLPLGDFARAQEGRPTDPAVFRDEQKRRWEERSRDPSAQPR